jgi:hypothetical protein
VGDLFTDGGWRGVKKRVAGNREIKQNVKIYLLSGTQRDGEHEHRVACLVRARTEKSLARKIAAIFRREDSKPYALDHERAYFGYGDRLTLTEHDDTREITAADAEVLARLGVVHFA